MDKRNYLLFTNDYYASKEEIQKLGGRILQKVTDKVFFASLPKDIHTDSLKNSSFDEPAELDEISAIAAKTWKGWDQSFLKVYSNLKTE